MALGVSITVNGASDKELAAAATLVEVYECMGRCTTYRVQFGVGIAEGDLPMLADSRIDPGVELGVFTMARGEPQCLVKGPVYSQAIHLKHGGAGSSVEVIGGDLSLLMDREWKSAVWAEATDSGVVSTILGAYPDLVQDVEATRAVHAEAKHTLLQRETDLALVRRLAHRNGAHFWIDFDETGLGTAHFRRPKLDGDPEGELIINIAKAALDTVDITWDVHRPFQTTAAQIDLQSVEKIDGSVAQSPLIPLGGKGIAAIAAAPHTTFLAPAADDAGELMALNEGALIEDGFFLRASCSTTAAAVGKVLRSHRLVNLRGCGTRHSGNYFCSAVQHSINSNAHKMNLTLLRNGWGG